MPTNPDDTDEVYSLGMDIDLDVDPQELFDFNEIDIAELDEPNTTKTVDPVSTGAQEIQDIPKPTPTQDSDQGVQIVGQIKSSLYVGLIKILGAISSNMSKMDVITIDRGEMSSISDGGFIYCDMSLLFGNNSFDIIDPQTSIKQLKLIKGGDEVVFLNDAANSRYLITSIENNSPKTTVVLGQPDPSYTQKITKPILNEVLHSTMLDIEDVELLQSAQKTYESQFFIIELDTNSNELIRVSTSKREFYHNFADSDDTRSTTEYKLFKPFPILKPEEFIFEVHSGNNNDMWVTSKSKAGIISIEYMEKLSLVGEFDTFSL